MTDPDSPEGDRLQSRFDAAVEALEAQDWTGGMNLLLGLITGARAAEDHRLEALSRALLTQCLMETGQEGEAIKQVEEAFAAAEQSNDRDTIHRCMALRHTVMVLTEN